MPLISSELLALLRCPATRSALTEASPELLTRVNAAISAGKLVTHAGGVIDGPIEAALVNADQSWLYPVYNRAVNFLRDDAIPLAQLKE